MLKSPHRVVTHPPPCSSATSQLSFSLDSSQQYSNIPSTSSGRPIPPELLYQIVAYSLADWPLQDPQTLLLTSRLFYAITYERLAYLRVKDARDMKNRRSLLRQELSRRKRSPSGERMTTVARLLAEQYLTDQRIVIFFTTYMLLIGKVTFRTSRRRWAGLYARFEADIEDAVENWAADTVIICLQGPESGSTYTRVTRTIYRKGPIMTKFFRQRLPGDEDDVLDVDEDVPKEQLDKWWHEYWEQVAIESD